MKPIALLVFPPTFYIIMDMFYLNFSAWQSICSIGSANTNCVGTYRYTLGGAVFALLNGDWTIFASDLTGFITTPTGIFAVLSVVIGFLLILIGFGMTLEATAATVGARIGFNAQGSKFAQIIGFGLLLWALTLSLSGGWTNTIPYGFSFLFQTAFTLMFTIGLIWQAQSWL